MANARSVRVCEQFENENIEPDKVKSRIIKRAFEEYATGTYTLKSLADFGEDHGVVQKKGTPLAKVSVVKMRPTEHILDLSNIVVNGTTETLSQFFLRHCLKQSRKCSLRARSRESPKWHYHSRLRGLQSVASAAVRLRRSMLPIALAHATPTIAVPRRTASAQPYTQEKILATQLQTPLQSVSLPFLKLKKWTKQVTAWENESISEKCCPKFEREDSSKRRKTE